VLAGISPMIWRRLLLSSETSIPQPHEYLQIVFAGNGEHLHRFCIQGKDYGMADRGGIRFEDNLHEMLLSRFRLRPRESFRYEYDFTAHWRVNIRLELSFSEISSLNGINHFAPVGCQRYARDASPSGTPLHFRAIREVIERRGQIVHCLQALYCGW
jgi:hypothetical protein